MCCIWQRRIHLRSIMRTLSPSNARCSGRDHSPNGPATTSNRTHKLRSWTPVAAWSMEDTTGIIPTPCTCRIKVQPALRAHRVHLRHLQPLRWHPCRWRPLRLHSTRTIPTRTAVVYPCLPQGPPRTHAVTVARVSLPHRHAAVAVAVLFTPLMRACQWLLRESLSTSLLLLLLVVVRLIWCIQRLPPAVTALLLGMTATSALQACHLSDRSYPQRRASKAPMETTWPLRHCPG